MKGCTNEIVQYSGPMLLPMEAIASSRKLSLEGDRIVEWVTGVQ